MRHTIEFRIAGFQLFIYPSSFLVEVMPENRTGPRRDNFEELPAWVFHSKHAIWLTRENASNFHRALQGERIKRSILIKLQTRVA
ncbi:hypothetical protein L0244_04195 [bacterium]|nr:hypothetical protein [bacterium]